jgi:hypothetical protein
MTGYDRDLLYLAYRARARTAYNTKPGHTRSLTRTGYAAQSRRRIGRNPVIPGHTNETKVTKQPTVVSIRRSHLRTRLWLRILVIKGRLKIDPHQRSRKG